ALDRLQADVKTRRDEVRGVEPRAHLLHRVAVQLEELDTVKALRPHRPQYALEIVVASLTDRPELKPNAWHATKSTRQTWRWSRQPTAPFRHSSAAGNAPGPVGVFTLETTRRTKERVMFIPIDVPGSIRRNLIGAFADDPTIPYSPGRSRRFAGVVRSVARRPSEDTHLSSAGVTTALDGC